MSTNYWNTVLDTSSQSASASNSSSRQCSNCRRSFSSSRSYDEHLRTCGRQHQQQQQQTQHSQQSSEKPHVCSDCGTAFKKNSNLVKHMKLVHLGERNFVCPEPSCGRLFGQKSNLNSHVKAVHLGEKPFICPEAACGRRFSQKSGLKAHIKTVHNGERPYVCECGSSFGHRGDVSLIHTHFQPSLNRHIRVLHERQRPFECPICPEPRAFGRKSVLMRHMQTHDGAPSPASVPDARSSSTMSSS